MRGKIFEGASNLHYTYTQFELILVSVGGSDPSCLGKTQLGVLAFECYSPLKESRGLQLSMCICANVN